MLFAILIKLNDGGVLVLIEDGQDGVIVPYNDILAPSQTMRTSLNDLESTNYMGEQTGKKAKAFAAESIILEWEKYIVRLQKA